MVCLACLLPLFLVPIVNLLPLLFDFVMARIYRFFGWEYRKPERAPPACPYKPSPTKPVNNSAATESEAVVSDHNQKPIPVDDGKRD